MKKTILFLIASVSLSLNLNAQEKQGEVIYEEIMKLNIKIEGMAEEFLKKMPKESKSKKVLYFNEEASIYQNTKENENEMMHGMGGNVSIQVSGTSPDEKTYVNYKDGVKIQQKDFMTRRFLITSKKEKSKWKLTGEQKMILNYPCQGAVLHTKKDTIKAWFTPVIQAPTGPAGFSDLPGLILEVDKHHSKMRIVAKEINFKPIDKKLLSKPKKGKKVTAEKYAKIVEEKMKEMGANQNGKGGNKFVIMKVSR